MEQRDFKGVWIPREIWLDSRLTALDKVILVEIDSLDGENGCYISNESLAEFCQCSVTKVSLTISKLIDLQYIELKSFNGRLRVLKSRLSKNERQTCKKCEADLQKVKGNNIVNNSNEYQSYNNSIVRTATAFHKPTVEEVKAYCSERRNSVDAERFVDYYSSNGWRVGKSPMKDWKAAVRTWERNESPKRQNTFLAEDFDFQGAL